MNIFKNLFKPKEKKADFMLKREYIKAFSKHYHDKYDFGDIIDEDKNKVFIPIKTTGSMLYVYYDKKLKDIKYVAINEDFIDELALKWEKMESLK